jgi:hypothetical protein
MADDEYRVFLSAVSSEFRSARNALTDDFGARDVLVRVQEQFLPDKQPHTLLAALDDYISGCTTVICVIGKRSGACPPADAASAFVYVLPEGVTQASYTQWEYFLARHYNKGCLFYVAHDDYKPDEAAPNGDDHPELQHAFVERIRGLHYDSFRTTAELRALVGLQRWPERVARPGAPARKLIVLPYASIGPLFKGRDAFLRALGESLARGNAAALYGLGGVGKTRAAVEYAWTHRARYTAVFLLQGGTAAALQSGLAGLLTPLLLSDKAPPQEAERAEIALGWLNANPGWLLILDNLDMPEALDAASRMMGRLDSGHLLLTSRLERFPRGVPRQALDVLSPEAAAAFLLEATDTGRSKAPDDAARATTLAEELGGLALALEMAAATIDTRHLDFARYRALWQENRQRVIGWARPEIDGYNQAMAETWQTSVRHLTEPGRALLERLAYLAPDPVPDFLLDVPVPGVATEDAPAALDDLAAYSLATRDPEGQAFLVHRLVQDVTRRGLEEAGTATARLTEALGWVDAAFAGQPDDVRTWPRLSRAN